MGTFLGLLFEDARRGRVLPGPDSGAGEEPAAAQPPDIRPLTSHAEVVDLNERDGSGGNVGWQKLHTRFTTGRRDSNLMPWYRCLGVARGNGAVTAVIETHYVCLDYKSEYASFYAHLNSPLDSWTVRLHFFASPADELEVTGLDAAQVDSYLGYIVCREGGLPLVGRTLLRLPAYLRHPDAVTTAVEERVNFYGQRLPVRGVPFMQQDERVASCAHVAAWAIAYTAFRRGVIERHLIADLARPLARSAPLRPRVSGPLVPGDVSGLLGGVGLSASIARSPTRASGVHDLPSAHWDELPDDLCELLAGELGIPESPTRRNLSPIVVREFSEYSAWVLDEDDAAARRASRARHKALKKEQRRVRLGLSPSPGRGPTGGETPPSDQSSCFDPREPAVRAMHGLLDHLATPYLRSGWPIYLGTADHALVLCGRRPMGGTGLHFFHDDQIGPYLVSGSLPTIGRHGLHFQSGRYSEMPGPDRLAVLATEPGTDAVKVALEGGGIETVTSEDHLHAVWVVITAAPARAMLPPNEAVRAARRVMGGVMANAPALADSFADVEALGSADDVTACLVMGIDYKRDRRAQAESSNDVAALRAFSSVQLSEWVVVVEGTASREGDGQDASRTSGTSRDRVLWECVYDGSSGRETPRLLLCRVGEVVVTEFPRRPERIEGLRIGSDNFRPVTPPDTVGKI